MNKLRSWKERWDPDAEFVFAKRLKLGLPELDVALPGDPVPKEALGLHRLRRWWEARVIRLADPKMHPRPESMASLRRLTSTVWELRRPGLQPLRLSDRAEGERLLKEHEDSLKPKAAKKKKKGKKKSSPPAGEPKPELVQLSAQVWELRVPGQEPRKVRGKNKAAEALEEALKG